MTPTAKSLVIAPQWIGDAVMTEPLLRRLQARGERLTVGALPWVAPVYRAMPQVAEVIEFPFAHGGLQFKARRSIAKRLSGEFDKAYVLPNSLKSALLPFLASIAQRIGYLGEARVGLLTHRLKNPKNKPPMVAFYSALSGEPGIEKDRPQLHIDDAQIQATLNGLGLTRGGYIVFAPGAEFGPAKRWPASHFADLAGKLNLPVVLLAGGDCRKRQSGQQRFRLDACCGRAGRAASGHLRLVQSAAHAAAERQSQRVVAESRPRLPPAARLRTVF